MSVRQPGISEVLMSLTLLRRRPFSVCSKLSLNTAWSVLNEHILFIDHWDLMQCLTFFVEFPPSMRKKSSREKVTKPYPLFILQNFLGIINFLSSQYFPNISEL